MLANFRRLGVLRCVVVHRGAENYPSLLAVAAYCLPVWCTLHGVACTAAADQWALPCLWPGLTGGVHRQWVEQHAATQQGGGGYGPEQEPQLGQGSILHRSGPPGPRIGQELRNLWEGAGVGLGSRAVVAAGADLPSGTPSWSWRASHPEERQGPGEKFFGWTEGAPVWLGAGCS